MGLFGRIRKYLDYKTYLEDVRRRAVYEAAYNAKADELTRKMIESSESGVSGERGHEREVIVSLTTYGKRLYDVYLAIESIMQGSMKPDRIVLWLSDDILGKELPLSLQKQKGRGLEVMYCKDIRSYTKIIPSMRMFPEAVIVTIDDDVVYSFDMLEKLVVAYRENPSAIYANRIHRIHTDSDGQPLGYNDCWEHEVYDFEDSPGNFFTGVGGVLYPPHCLDDEVFNENIFLDICPSADDVWLNAMALKKGTPVRRVLTHDPKGNEYLINPMVQDTSLSNINVLNKANDIQIRAVFNKYDLGRLLKK